MATAAGTLGPSVPVQHSLRSRQIVALKRMLNLNVQVSKSSVPTEPVWKVLVYDQCGQDIISPLMTVKELRDLGVTLHLTIDSSREPVSDASAVYFIVPAQRNVNRICRDLGSHLYDSYYFNFITPISRPMLEELAKATVDANSVSQVTKVYDQYLNFISLEDDLFLCRHQDKKDISYYALNRTDAKDTDINNIRDVIVDSLFSVFVTTGYYFAIFFFVWLVKLMTTGFFFFLLVVGTIPIIRCPRGNAAEMVAETLDKKIRDNLRDPRNSMFTGDGLNVSQLSFTRPLLVILDRNMDLATPLHHTWTYQALVHDVFDLELNRVNIPASADETLTGSSKPKTYDLHPTDRFWTNHRGSPFPNVADSVQTEVAEYRVKEEEISKLRTAMGMNEGDDPEMFSGTLTDSTARLTSAISSLPELMERKKSIDMHTNIATSLLDQIKERKLDVYYEIEDKMTTKPSLDKSVMDILSDPSAGTPEDKLRLFLICYLLLDMSESELTQHVSVLESAGADLNPVEYIKKWKAYSKIAANPRAQKLGAAGASSTSMSVFQQLYSSGSNMLQGVKNLVIGTKNLPVTRIVDQLMDLKAMKETEDFRYFDPKLLRGSGGDNSSIPKSRGPFQEAYVFIVGGGNYIEYQNLQDYCKRQQPQQKRITYGTTELMNASEFLAQLSLLGNTAD